jgi:DNA-binding transcriptional LysR family regulator
MIHSRNTPAILDAVQSRQFDLGIVGRQPPYPGVETLFQTSAPYVCLLPEDHALVGEAGALDLEKLTETDRFVTFGDAFPTEMLAIDSELSHRMQQNSRLSATNVPVAAALVRETGALTIADPFSAEQAVRMGGVVFRPIRQKLTYHIAIVCGGRENLSRPACAFADLLARQISDRIEALSGYIQADD